MKWQVLLDKRKIVIIINDAPNRSNDDDMM